MESKTPQFMLMALGAWLLLSTFLWPHSSAQYTNCWAVGGATIIVAVISMSIRPARYLNALMGAWLFISAWALTTMSVGTVWNNIVVGLAMVAVSLMSGTKHGIHIRGRRHAHAHT